MAVFIHASADISDKAYIGDGSSLWQHVQVREGAQIGSNCILGKGVYVDTDVLIGDNVKIQNYVSIYRGVTLEYGVFVGPHVCFTNDLYPRAVNQDGSMKNFDDWKVSPTLIRYGAAIGANSTILCGITIGCWAMIGAGSLATRNVPDYGLAWGNPARLHGFVCSCGSRVKEVFRKSRFVLTECTRCQTRININTKDWEGIL